MTSWFISAIALIDRDDHLVFLKVFPRPQHPDQLSNDPKLSSISSPVACEGNEELSIHLLLFSALDKCDAILSATRGEKLQEERTRHQENSSQSPSFLTQSRYSVDSDHNNSIGATKLPLNSSTFPPSRRPQQFGPPNVTSETSSSPRQSSHIDPRASLGTAGGGEDNNNDNDKKNSDADSSDGKNESAVWKNAHFAEWQREHQQRSGAGGAVRGLRRSEGEQTRHSTHPIRGTTTLAGVNGMGGGKTDKYRYTKKFHHKTHRKKRKQRSSGWEGHETSPYWSEDSDEEDEGEEKEEEENSYRDLDEDPWELIEEDHRMQRSSGGGGARRPQPQRGQGWRLCTNRRGYYPNVEGSTRTPFSPRSLAWMGKSCEVSPPPPATTVSAASPTSMGAPPHSLISSTTDPRYLGMVATTTDDVYRCFAFRAATGITTLVVTSSTSPQVIPSDDAMVPITRSIFECASSCLCNPFAGYTAARELGSHAGAGVHVSPRASTSYAMRRKVECCQREDEDDEEEDEESVLREDAGYFYNSSPFGDDLDGWLTNGDDEDEEEELQRGVHLRRWDRGCGRRCCGGSGARRRRWERAVAARGKLWRAMELPNLTSALMSSRVFQSRLSLIIASFSHGEEKEEDSDQQPREVEQGP